MTVHWQEIILIGPEYLNVLHRRQIKTRTVIEDVALIHRGAECCIASLLEGGEPLLDVESQFRPRAEAVFNGSLGSNHNVAVIGPIGGIHTTADVLRPVVADLDAEKRAPRVPRI